MNVKKTIACALLAALIPTAAFAHGQMWVDKNANVPKYKKIVIFPLSNKGNEYDYLLSDDEKSDIYKMNDYLDKKFVRKLKYVTVDLGSPLAENNQIRTDEEKYKPLYERFATEEARSKAVEDITMADAYLVPVIRENRVEEHISPATYVDVLMRTWTEENNGPNGNRIYDERTWVEHHLIPERLMRLRHMEMEQTMYVEGGKKVLTFVNRDHVYFISMEKMFENLIDEFRKDIKEIKKNDGKDKGGSGARITFRPIFVQPNVTNGDEYVARAANYAVQDGARRVKGARFVYPDANNVQAIPAADYYVTGVVNRWDETRVWIPPSADTSVYQIDSHKEKWVDAAGKEHEKTITHWKTVINDHYGHYAYTAHVGGALSLANAKTGQAVITYNGAENDDKSGDAYRHFVKNFYKRVDKYLSGDKTPMTDDVKAQPKTAPHTERRSGGLWGALTGFGDALLGM